MASRLKRIAMGAETAAVAAAMISTLPYELIKGLFGVVAGEELRKTTFKLGKSALGNVMGWEKPDEDG